MANSGSVSWMFKRKAVFAMPKVGIDEEELMELALEMGADDVTTDEEQIFGVEADPSEFLVLKEVFDSKEWELLDASIRYIPDNTVEVGPEDAEKINILVDLLEDDEDVQGVHHNAEFI